MDDDIEVRPVTSPARLRDASSFEKVHPRRPSSPREEDGLRLRRLRLTPHSPSLAHPSRALSVANRHTPTTQLGDALQWLAFLVPWCAFALYAHVALALRLGFVGLVEASCVSVASLPFWRAACRRPAFQPLAALLRRFHAKRNLPPFEEIPDASSENDGLKNTHDWRVAFEKRVPDAQAELAAFTRQHAGASEPRRAFFREGASFPTSGRDASSRDEDFSRGRREMKTSNDETSERIVRDPASRLAAAGLGVFPLCDETLVRPNAAAARHFPATCAAVRAAGGFGARLWVLRPDTNRTPLAGFSRGVSDGYWRAHVVLDADEAEAETEEEETFSFTLNREKNAASDVSDAVFPSRGASFFEKTLGDFAGIRAGDETRRAEIGDLIVVNDAFERRWFHEKENKNKKEKAREVSGANASDADARERDAREKETRERRGEQKKKNVSKKKKPPRVGAAVVLTFDVLRPEHAACRVLYVRHKARLVREAGERNAGERTWRSLALAMLGNLS